MNTLKIIDARVLCILAVINSHAILAADLFDPDGHPITIGYVNSPSSSSFSLASQSQNQAFIASYAFLPSWSGDVKAQNISPEGAISDTINWSAQAQLDLASVTDDNRKIITFSYERNGRQIKIPFRWDKLSETQKDALGNDEKLLNFIRGDRSKEQINGGPYRNRSSRLGDTIHSDPLYWNDGENETLFVGANDGMLHAFDAITGRERFAYIPSIFVNGDGSSQSAKLHALGLNPYVHKYFVDGQFAARTYNSQSILVGGLGGGGKALFALDITKSVMNNIKNSNERQTTRTLLWEVTNNSIGYANLGHTYAKPVMLTLEDKAVAIVANGYNSTNGAASLFVIKSNNGALVKEIVVDQGGPDSTNGLSSPTAVDIDLDGKFDFAYAGDLNGNLWKFDLSSLTATKLYNTNPAQAITMEPSIIYHPFGGKMVLFATGKLFTDADAKDNSIHYTYGIWDRPIKYRQNSTLFEPTLSEDIYRSTSTSRRVRTISPRSDSSAKPNWSEGGDFGWRVALPGKDGAGGERVVGNGAFIAGPFFVFLTTNPTIDGSENWWMQINTMTGSMDTDKERFDLNNDGQFTIADQIAGKGSPVGLYIGDGVRSQLTVFSTSLGGSIYYGNVNYNPTDITTTKETETFNPVGVPNGHFDFDIYSPTSRSLKHEHEYDDKKGVTGVNMLDAAEPAFNLSTIINPGTSFKVIAANQYFNPAVQISIGQPYDRTSVEGYISIKRYSTEETADDLLNAVKTYTMSNIQSLALNMPLDSFSVKDWWRGGVPSLPADLRVGLQPTQTHCVKGNDRFDITGAPASNGIPHNGALTLQVIKGNTPASALELNVSGHREYGWRVKLTEQSTWVLAEYTIFWHYKRHGGGCGGGGGGRAGGGRGGEACFEDSNWKKDPPELDDDCNATLSHSGTDPRVIAFGSQGNTDTLLGLENTSTTTTIVNSDGSVSTITITIIENSDGSYTKTTETTTMGADNSTDTNHSEIQPCTYGGSKCISPIVVMGRVNWREMRR